MLEWSDLNLFRSSWSDMIECKLCLIFVMLCACRQDPADNDFLGFGII